MNVCCAYFRRAKQCQPVAKKQTCFPVGGDTWTTTLSHRYTCCTYVDRVMWIGMTPSAPVRASWCVGRAVCAAALRCLFKQNHVASLSQDTCSDGARHPRRRRTQKGLGSIINAADVRTHTCLATGLCIRGCFGDAAAAAASAATSSSLSFAAVCLRLCAERIVGQRRAVLNSGHFHRLRDDRCAQRSINADARSVSASHHAASACGRSSSSGSGSDSSIAAAAARASGAAAGASPSCRAAHAFQACHDALR